MRLQLNQFYDIPIVDSKRFEVLESPDKQCEQHKNILSNLKKVNCFVGANNSGKSQLIRQLYKIIYEHMAPNPSDAKLTEGFHLKLEKLEGYIIQKAKENRYNLPRVSIPQLMNLLLTYIFEIVKSFRASRNFIPSFSGSMKELAVYKHLESFTQYKKISSKEDFRECFCLSEKLSIKFVEEIGNSIKKHSYHLMEEYTMNGYTKELTERVLKKLFCNVIGELFIKAWAIAPKEPNQSEEGGKRDVLYIPILRGIRKLQNYDIFRERIREDYQITEVFTGYTIYSDLQDHLLGDHEKRELIKDYENFLSESFFERKAVQLIPKIGTDLVYVRIGTQEYPLHELGDGIKAIIILTFPLFLRKNQYLAVFVEEPELHLHPKWQRFLLKTLKTQFPHHQYFFSTHSNVFLNDDAVSTYRVFKKEEQGVTRIHVEHKHITKDMQDLFRDLGYQPIDLVQANFVIWVEGPSDRIYINKFIELLNGEKSLEEGRDYTIMFYSGYNNLEHLNIGTKPKEIPILTVNPNCAFIIDSDRSVKSEEFNLDKIKEDFRKTCEEEGIFCWITGVRAIENLIPPDIWEKACKAYAKEIRSGWDESEMVIENNKYNGDFKTYPLVKKFKSKQGTRVSVKNSKAIAIDINNKIKIAREVVKVLGELPPGEVTKRVKELVDKIEEVSGLK